MDALEFMVTLGDGVVQVRWLEPLGRLNTGLYQILKESLQELPGVERVEVGRYSAVITIATHVSSESDVAEAVFEELTDSGGEFAAGVRFQQFGRPVTVDIAGRTVIL